MDFPYDHTQYKWDHYFKPALKRYFELNGHTDIPQLFRIGHGDEKMAGEAMGFPLGVRVTNLRRRHRGEYTSKIEEDAEELAQLGFCHDSNLLEEQRYRQRVLLPLQIYLQKFGNLDVSTSFKVPDCPPWPKMAAGSKLGSAILNLRNRGDDAECVARDPEFKKLGFDWDPFTTELNERIFPASEIYKLENGHCKVPPDFIVTSTKP